ncbi:MAG: gliding motility-associated ABC transporter substrate-binding protein GldG [Bacteroidales bacterium]|nr:gliding motility-associated ABC transporter substrate-binding protein GldG [Bacteroidales bacterium]
MTKRNNIKRQNLIEFTFLVVILVLLNVISPYLSFRWDLTAEKRFTLNNSTKKILSDVDDMIYLKVYLDGEMPPGFKRLQNSLKEMLDEFRIYAKDNLQYEFINLDKLKDKKEKDNIYKQLYQQGLDPVNVYNKDDKGANTQQILFPGAIISFKNKQLPINFLNQSINKTPEENLNNSVQDLEFNLISSLHKLQTSHAKTIAFIEGHGEWPADDVADLMISLSQNYIIKRVTINKQIKAIDTYYAIVIAHPDSVFNKFDLFIIDQYIMKGGKVLWVVDGTSATMDSLSFRNTTIALDKIDNNNIGKMLFHYGVRVNANLIQDLQCAYIPINIAVAGAPPKFDPRPWLYSPLTVPVNSNPISRNLNLIKGEFTSSIDTVGDDPNIQKTVLITTSKYTRLINAPVQVDLAIVAQKPDANLFLLSYVPVAAMVEGKFRSFFEFHLEPEFENNKLIHFIKESKPTKMIVVGDADMIRNQTRNVNGKTVPYPLGFDRYSGQTYGNKNFFLNAINFLLDDDGLINTRSREIKLRVLDKTYIDKNYSLVQMLNLILPLIILAVFGIFYFFLTRKKFKIRTKQ